jgi:hypothetical protein
MTSATNRSETLMLNARKNANASIARATNFSDSMRQRANATFQDMLRKKNETLTNASRVARNVTDEARNRAKDIVASANDTVANKTKYAMEIANRTRFFANQSALQMKKQAKWFDNKTRFEAETFANTTRNESMHLLNTTKNKTAEMMLQAQNESKVIVRTANNSARALTLKTEYETDQLINRTNHTAKAINATAREFNATTYAKAAEYTESVRTTNEQKMTTITTRALKIKGSAEVNATEKVVAAKKRGIEKVQKAAQVAQLIKRKAQTKAAAMLQAVEEEISDGKDAEKHEKSAEKFRKDLAKKKETEQKRVNKLQEEQASREQAAKIKSKKERLETRLKVKKDVDTARAKARLIMNNATRVLDGTRMKIRDLQKQVDRLNMDGGQGFAGAAPDVNVESLRKARQDIQKVKEEQYRAIISEKKAKHMARNIIEYAEEQAQIHRELTDKSIVKEEMEVQNKKLMMKQRIARLQDADAEARANLAMEGNAIDKKLKSQKQMVAEREEQRAVDAINDSKEKIDESKAEVKELEKQLAEASDPAQKAVLEKKLSKAKVKEAVNKAKMDDAAESALDKATEAADDAAQDVEGNTNLAALKDKELDMRENAHLEKKELANALAMKVKELQGRTISLKQKIALAEDLVTSLAKAETDARAEGKEALAENDLPGMRMATANIQSVSEKKRRADEELAELQAVLRNKSENIQEKITAAKEKQVQDVDKIDESLIKKQDALEREQEDIMANIEKKASKAGNTVALKSAKKAEEVREERKDATSRIRPVMNKAKMEAEAEVDKYTHWVTLQQEVVNLAHRLLGATSDAERGTLDVHFARAKEAAVDAGIIEEAQYQMNKLNVAQKAAREARIAMGTATEHLPYEQAVQKLKNAEKEQMRVNGQLNRPMDRRETATLERLHSHLHKAHELLTQIRTAVTEAEDRLYKANNPADVRRAEREVNRVAALADPKFQEAIANQRAEEKNVKAAAKVASEATTNSTGSAEGAEDPDSDKVDDAASKDNAKSLAPGNEETLDSAAELGSATAGSARRLLFAPEPSITSLGEENQEADLDAASAMKSTEQTDVSDLKNKDPEYVAARAKLNVSDVSDADIHNFEAQVMKQTLASKAAYMRTPLDLRNDTTDQQLAKLVQAKGAPVKAQAFKVQQARDEAAKATKANAVAKAAAADEQKWLDEESAGIQEKIKSAKISPEEKEAFDKRKKEAEERVEEAIKAEKAERRAYDKVTEQMTTLNKVKKVETAALGKREKYHGELRYEAGKKTAAKVLSLREKETSAEQAAASANRKAQADGDKVKESAAAMKMVNDERVISSNKILSLREMATKAKSRNLKSQIQDKLLVETRKQEKLDKSLGALEQTHASAKIRAAASAEAARLADEQVSQRTQETDQMDEQDNAKVKRAVAKAVAKVKTDLARAQKQKDLQKEVQSIAGSKSAEDARKLRQEMEKKHKDASSKATTLQSELSSASGRAAEKLEHELKYTQFVLNTTSTGLKLAKDTIDRLSKEEQLKQQKAAASEAEDEVENMKDQVKDAEKKEDATEKKSELQRMKSKEAQMKRKVDRRVKKGSKEAIAKDAQKIADKHAVAAEDKMNDDMKKVEKLTEKRGDRDEALQGAIAKAKASAANAKELQKEDEEDYAGRALEAAKQQYAAEKQKAEEKVTEIGKSPPALISRAVAKMDRMRTQVQKVQEDRQSARFESRAFAQKSLDQANEVNAAVKKARGEALKKKEQGVVKGVSAEVRRLERKSETEDVAAVTLQKTAAAAAIKNDKVLQKLKAKVEKETQQLALKQTSVRSCEATVCS